MTTANEIISEALGDIGIGTPGDAVNPDDAGAALIKLNTLIDTIKIDSGLAYATNEVTANIMQGASAITIGTGGMVNTLRPAMGLRGNRHFFRAGGIDYPFEIVDQAQFADISLKNVGGFMPVVGYYNAELPHGKLNLWPVLGQNAELHLFIDAPFTDFADLTTEYTFPPGYRAFLVANLAVICAPMFEREASQTVMRQATTTRYAIEKLNYSVPQIDVGQRHSVWNRQTAFGLP